MIKYSENVHGAAYSLVRHAAIAGGGIGTKISSVVANDRGPVEGSFAVREQEGGDIGSGDEKEQTEDVISSAHYSGGAGNVTLIRKARHCTAGLHFTR